MPSMRLHGCFGVRGLGSVNSFPREVSQLRRGGGRLDGALWPASDAGSVGEELAVFREDGSDGDHGGVDAQRQRGEARGFEDDFEGARPLFRRGAEDAAVAFTDDAALGGKAVDDRGVIPREQVLGRGEGGFEEVG